MPPPMHQPSRTAPRCHSSGSSQGARSSSAATTGIPDVNQVLKGTNGRLLPFGWWRFLQLSRLVTRVRAVTTGVIPEYRETGILAALMYRLVMATKRQGFTQIEFSWILENNFAANQTIMKGGGRMYKTFRLYQKALPDHV